MPAVLPVPSQSRMVAEPGSFSVHRASHQAKMRSAAQQAAVQAVAAAPVVASALSGLLSVLIEITEQQERLEGQCDSLRERLPKLLRQLDDLSKDPDPEDSEELVQAVRTTVEAFNNFVQDRKRTSPWVRLWVGKRASAARASLKEFESRLVWFDEDIKVCQQLLGIRSLQLAANTNALLKKVDKKLDNVTRMTKEERTADPGYVQNLLRGNTKVYMLLAVTACVCACLWQGDE